MGHSTFATEAEPRYRLKVLVRVEVIDSKDQIAAHSSAVKEAEGPVELATTGFAKIIDELSGPLGDAASEAFIGAANALDDIDAMSKGKRRAKRRARIKLGGAAG